MPHRVAHLGEHITRRRHPDRVTEVIAEQHRADREPADDRRRDRQENERHRNNSRRFVQVRLLFLTHAFLAMEHEEEHAERVQRGDKYAEQYAQVGDPVRQLVSACRTLVPVRFFDGLDQQVLREEARRTREADQGQRPDQRRPVGNRHVLADATHLADVLLVVHRDDDRAGREEQQRLEERVRHQVEDRGAVGRGAQCHGHVTELRQRRVGNDTLDVVLHDAQQSHEERSYGADNDHEAERRRRQFEQRRHARHHEDAGGDHRGRVDQGRNGCRAFHRIRQPDMQRRLGRFTHRTDEQQDADDRHRIPRVAGEHFDLLCRYRVGLAEHGRVVERAREHHDAGDTKNEAEVAHAVDNEGFQVRKNRGFPLVPEPDQQVGHEPDCFPAKKQLQEVVGHDQHEHREREQGDIAEETLVTRVFMHVADRVDMHHQRHEGHDAHHERGQPVHEETDLHVQPVCSRPRVDTDVLRRGTAPEHVLENQE